MKHFGIKSLIFSLCAATIVTTMVAGEQGEQNSSHFEHDSVYIPDEIKKCLVELHLYDSNVPTFSHEINFISKEQATSLIHDARAVLKSSTGTISDISHAELTTLLDTYQAFINSDEGVERRVKQFEVLLDLWVQNALRARLLTVDGNVSIQGNLSVAGSTLLGSTTIAGSEIVQGNLTVVETELIANTTPSTSCTSGALVVNGGVGIAGDVNICGTLNARGITGVIGATGATGPTGATGTTGATGASTTGPISIQ